MDWVIPCRPGINEELRYALRSLAAHVHHDNVWIIGGAPAWVPNQPDLVQQIPNRPIGRTPDLRTSGHMQVALNDNRISDPFIWASDDVYAVKPVGYLPRFHRGSLQAVINRHAKASRSNNWADSMIAAGVALKRLGVSEPLCYDTHHPIIVHKDAMRKALQLAGKNPSLHASKRTVYGNLAGLGGIAVSDCKAISPSKPLPRGSWLSSDDRTFGRTVAPVLRWLFPDPGPYEI